MEKTLICLGAGYSQIPLIKTAKSLGLKVVTIDRNQNSPGFKLSDVIINESLENINSVIHKLKKIRSKYKFVGVVARTTGKPLYLAAKISKDFGLLGLTDNIIDISIKKSSLRNFCRKNHLRFPEGKSIKNNNVLLENLTYPIIIKPDYSTIGKFRISKCLNSNDVKKYFKSANLLQNSQFEIQSYVDGIDCGCLCWANHGKVEIITWLDELVGIDYTKKIVGIGINIPSVINETRVALKAEKIIKKIVQKFRKVNSLLLISFRVSFDGIPYIIEIHADLGGDLIAEKLLPEANPDFDFFRLAIEIATNKKRSLYKIPFKPTAMYYSSKSNLVPVYEQYNMEPFIVKGNIEYNLQFLKKVIKKRNLQLLSMPKHEEWYKQNVA